MEQGTRSETSDYWEDEKTQPRNEGVKVSEELTFGQKAVGITFNPGGNPQVEAYKREYAGLIDTLNIERETSTNPEVKRQLSLAITELQTSQMWAVKALTWKY